MVPSPLSKTWCSTTTSWTKIRLEWGWSRMKTRWGHTQPPGSPKTSPSHLTGLLGMHVLIEALQSSSMLIKSRSSMLKACGKMVEAGVSKRALSHGLINTPRYELTIAMPHHRLPHPARILQWDKLCSTWKRQCHLSFKRTLMSTSGNAIEDSRITWHLQLDKSRPEMPRGV